MLILLIACLAATDVDRPLTFEIRGENQSLVTLNLHWDDAASYLVLQLSNEGPSTVILPNLVTPYHFLQVEGVPWKSGDVISHAAPYNVYGNGYERVKRGATLRHELPIGELLGPRRNTDGAYRLGLTYNDSWSEHPALGRVPLGTVLISKEGEDVEVRLVKQ
jgi:hypothetical protein